MNAANTKPPLLSAEILRLLEDFPNGVTATVLARKLGNGRTVAHVTACCNRLAGLNRIAAVPGFGPNGGAGYFTNAHRRLWTGKRFL